jgi:hypothetical protein
MKQNVSLCFAKEVSKESPKEPLLRLSSRISEPFSMRSDEERRHVHCE